MPSAMKAVLARWRAVALAVLAGGVAGVAGGHGGGAPLAAVGPEAQSAGAGEAAAWAAAQQAGTAEAYQRYLELFPIGARAEEAFRLLIELSFQRRPVTRLVDVEPAAAAGVPEQTRVVAAADLALY